MAKKMKSYLNDAQQHSSKIRYYYDHAGANGHTQALDHYNKLGTCFGKAAMNRSGEAFTIKTWYEDAAKMMDTMKRRAEGKPDVEPPLEE